jgi:antitoxin component YwqK of YwqJK toxin-antitoxin module
MGKKCLILLLVFLSHLGFSQLNQVDKNGKKQGEWKKKYDKLQVFEYIGQFKDDHPYGTFYYYYPSSKKKAIITHDLKTKRSEAIMYHENGVVIATGIYKNQKKDSIWNYYGPSGRLSYKETYKNGMLNGQRAIFYVPEDVEDKSQRVSRLENYVNNVLDGEVKEFFDFGTVKMTGRYVNGKKEGKFITNDINGKTMFVEYYKNGLKHGFSIGYNPQGVETGRRYYQTGRELVGKELDAWLNHCKSKGINPNQ